MSPKKIEEFSGIHRFLSNFWSAEVTYLGEKYPSVEHAYQAAKAADLKDREKIRIAGSPTEARSLGRKVRLRSDWAKMRVPVMTDLLEQKFGAGTELCEKLLKTGDCDLVEGNYWGDVFWGVCRGIGENNLGKLLVQIRTQRRGKT